MVISDRTRCLLVLCFRFFSRDSEFIMQHIITYCIMNGTMLNISALVTDFDHAMVPAGPQASWATWVQPATREDVLAAFTDFGPDVRAIFECIEKPNKWSMHGLYPPLESHVFSAKADARGDASEEASKSNIVLVGDAAHAMLSNLGAGASVGIEGAYVLTSLLAHPQTRRANLSVSQGVAHYHHPAHKHASRPSSAHMTLLAYPARHTSPMQASALAISTKATGPVDLAMKAGARTLTFCGSQSGSTILQRKLLER